MVNETVTPGGRWLARETQPMTDTSKRPDDRSVETEDQRPPPREGRPPRPATEPRGSEGSSNSGETETDPATGAPNPD